MLRIPKDKWAKLPGLMRVLTANDDRVEPEVTDDELAEAQSQADAEHEADEPLTEEQLQACAEVFQEQLDGLTKQAAEVTEQAADAVAEFLHVMVGDIDDMQHDIIRVRDTMDTR